MKVNIDAQCLCQPLQKRRGIQISISTLLQACVRRGKLRYSACFFDKFRERNNREFVSAYLYDLIDSIELIENNYFSYKDISVVSDERRTVKRKPYSSYTDLDADVFYFPTINFPIDLDINRSVVTIHDAFAYTNSRYISQYPERCKRNRESIEYLKKRNDVWITVPSKAVKNDLINVVGIGDDRIFVVPWAADKAYFYSEKNNSILTEVGISKPYILYLGSLQEHKGVKTLVDAFEQLNNKDFQLVICGVYTTQEVTEVAGNNKKKNDILFPGFVTDEQKRGLLSKAELFVFPSYYEGFGLPILEAMACGTPVICTDVSSLPEVGGTAVKYFKAGDTEALAELMMELIDDEVQRDKMRKDGIIQCNNFSWDKTAAMMEKVFEDRYCLAT